MANKDSADREFPRVAAPVGTMDSDRFAHLGPSRLLLPGRDNTD